MAKQKGRIPRTNTAIVLTCLFIIGGIIIVYPLLGKAIGIDLYGAISILFVIILPLLNHAGVEFSKAVDYVKSQLGRK